MKTKLHSLLILLFAFATANTFAQIPNSGFENWAGFIYEDPQGWWTTNYGCSGTFYPVTKSTDHYPVSVGNYSIRLESDTSLLLNYCGYGFTWSNLDTTFGPGFPIIGHPTSFTGYYKFLPQNGDTVTINVLLFQSGSVVANAILSGTTSVPNWTSFNIPISTYTNADSGLIILSSYNGNEFSFPYGNSVLFVDNLNFDVLITSTNDLNNYYNNTTVYPNPTSDFTILEFNNSTKDNCTLTLYDMQGRLVRTITDITTDKVAIERKNLTSGLYFFQLQTDRQIVATGKLTIE